MEIQQDYETKDITRARKQAEYKAAFDTVKANFEGQQSDFLRNSDLAIAEYEEKLAQFSDADSIRLSIPNLPADDIPTGGEDQAVVVKEWGEPRTFEFKPFDHVELGQRLQLANFEAGARLSGSGFPVMMGQGAMLQRALINYMLDLHIGRHGYTEVRPPFVVRPHCAVGTGNLPKFADQMYEVRVPGGSTGVTAGDDVGRDSGDDARATSAPDFYLIPTAEMPLANLYREQILDNPLLPIKLCAYSPCFRTEAGSYGKDARGLTRLHQFEKVELIRIAAPDASWDSLDQMTREAETVLEALNLPYRRKLLPSGDMAFASAKTFDLEVYCPAEGAWREVSSISNTTDYQARGAAAPDDRCTGDLPDRRRDGRSPCGPAPLPPRPRSADPRRRTAVDIDLRLGAVTVCNITIPRNIYG